KRDAPAPMVRTKQQRLVSHRRAQWDFFSKKLSEIKIKFRWWCPGAELNHRHLHFQCSALPTELPGRRARAGRRTKERGGYRGSIPGCPERPCALAIRAQDASSPRFADDAPSSSSSSLTGTA